MKKNMKKSSTEPYWKMHTVDLDYIIPYPGMVGLPVASILKHVKVVWWRVSAGRRGSHWKWFCPIPGCRRCRHLQYNWDDRKRIRHDRKRPSYTRNVLWDRKGKRQAGPWHEITH